MTSTLQLRIRCVPGPYESSSEQHNYESAQSTVHPHATYFEPPISIEIKIECHYSNTLHYYMDITFFRNLRSLKTYDSRRNRPRLRSAHQLVTIYSNTTTPTTGTS